ncbi:hypothetical protein COLO4_08616 [Corchorus olitorius]|uniref:Late embryogenesis abundant protein, LEA-14 n=1 Tax=Corchorus olitorius TaxID=93759 RepID=A0A1R3KF42_9ROSI|nr:hypothetical protein COLO4_08616 [Corchorus olitorius]
MLPLADQKQLNLAKGDCPYDFSPLPQDACVVPIKEELPNSDSQAEENKNVSSSEPDPSSILYESGTRGLLMEITHWAGLLIIMAIVLYRHIVNINFMYPPPLLETNSLTISNINISDSNLVGIWDVNITFGHSVDDYAEITYYNLIAGFIYYKQESKARNNLLAGANAMRFFVRPKEHSRVHLEFKNVGLETGKPGLEDQVMKEINNEIENGVLHFSLELVVEAEFQKWRKIWLGLHSNRFRRYCWDLMAGIDRVAGKGRLIHVMAVSCD